MDMNLYAEWYHTVAIVTGFHYVVKYGNPSPVVFDYCYWVVFSSGICRVALSSWQFLLMILDVCIVESTRVSCPHRDWPGFSLQYFGPSFVHDASKTPVSVPPYIDPYELLEDERLSRPSPDVFWTWIVQEPVQKCLQEIVIHSPTFSFFLLDV